MSTYVIGDVHGNYKGLLQAIERSPLKEGDTLIFLGDLIDGHSDSFEVIEYIIDLYSKYDVVLIKGNHEIPFIKWIHTGVNEWNWKNGQIETAISYMNNLLKDGSKYEQTNNGYKVALNPGDIPKHHKKLFNSQINYYIDEHNNLFIHGGFNRYFKLKEQMDYVYYWDRDLWKQALSFKAMTKTPGYKEYKFKMVDNFKEIFIGHTSTEFWGQDTPMNAANIWNLDTGGGWFGRITIMNIDTKEYWQSNRALDLYPSFTGKK